MYNKEIIVFDFILLVNFPVLVAFLLADQQKSTKSGLKASKHFTETLMTGGHVCRQQSPDCCNRGWKGFVGGTQVHQRASTAR
jgi:hypothetical protein